MRALEPECFICGKRITPAEVTDEENQTGICNLCFEIHGDPETGELVDW